MAQDWLLPQGGWVVAAIAAAAVAWVVTRQKHPPPASPAPRKKPARKRPKKSATSSQDTNKAPGQGEPVEPVDEDEPPAAASTDAAVVPDDEKTMAAEEVYRVGDRVDALWQGATWHPGRVVSAKPLGAVQRTQSPQVRGILAVECCVQGGDSDLKGLWRRRHGRDHPSSYCARWAQTSVVVSNVVGAGRYSYGVAYDDGETETRVAASRLRRRQQHAAETAREIIAKTTSDPRDAALPDLGDCVAYRKDGLSSQEEEEDHRDAVRPPPPKEVDVVVTRAPPEEEDDSDDEFDAGVVQSEADWKAAAPRPRRPPRAEKPAPPKTTTPPAAAKAAAEKNRKKREKQKAQKLAVRELMRAQL